MGHFAATYLLGGSVQALRFGFGDVQMQIGILSRQKEAAVLLAGPCVNLILFLLFRHIFAEFAVISFFLGGFNLLPMLPLDGGKIMLTIFHKKSVLLLGSVIGALVLIGAAVFASVRFESGLWPVCAAFAIFLRLVFTGEKEKAVAFLP